MVLSVENNRFSCQRELNWESDQLSWASFQKWPLWTLFLIIFKRTSVFGKRISFTSQFCLNFHMRKIFKTMLTIYEASFALWKRECWKNVELKMWPLFRIYTVRLMLSMDGNWPKNYLKPQKHCVKSISTFCISVTMVTEKFNGVHGTYIADQTCYEW